MNLIRLVKVKKKYGNRVLFKNVNVSFESKGFYSIVGPSGCGKTTLLNIISGINKEYEGNIFFNDKNIKSLDCNNLRINHFSYVFQSFNLFENETVFNNILLVIDSDKEINKFDKIRKIDEVLEVLQIKELKNNYVCKLSGGEKQRVAIARALITSPDVIFLDEPTGSLDEENTNAIFNILKNISKKYLVICVTHDNEMAKKYSDKIILFGEEGYTFNDNKPNEMNTSLLLSKNTNRIKKQKISLKFIFRHFFSSFKLHKLRYIISSAFISFSLVCLGFSLLLSTTISTSLNDSFSKILGEDTIIFKRSDDNFGIKDYCGANFHEINEIFNKYEEDLSYIGVNYIVDFENFFPDINELYNVSVKPYKKINGFTIRHFNEYTCLENFEKETVYPKISTLKIDEIVLGINYQDMKSLCLSMQVVKTYESLGNFLKNNDLFVSLFVSNNDRNYSDEQMFRVKGVIPSSKPTIFHTNSLFNEILFEDIMRFPSTLELNRNFDTPWIMKKLYYLKTKNFQNVFLDKFFYDEEFDDYIFDSDNEKYSPQSCPDPLFHTNKVYCYSVIKNPVSLKCLKLLDDANISFESYYFSTNGGYYNFGGSLYNGFVNDFYISNEKEKLINQIDKFYNVDIKDQENVIIDEEIGKGSLINKSDKSVKFSSRKDSLKEGTFPKNINEIVISSSLAKKIRLDSIDKEVFVSFNSNTNVNSDLVRKDFRTISIKVVGIIENDDFFIYQNPNFSISLFRDLFKISSFNLDVNSVVFICDKKEDKAKIVNLNRYLDEYIFLDPLKEVSDSINSTLSYIEIILLSLSGVSSFFTFLILLVINYINNIETKKEIAILCMLGFSFGQIKKMVYFNNSINISFSLIISVISLLFSNIILNYLIGKTIGVSSSIIIPYSSVLIMVVASLFLSITSLISLKKTYINVNI